MKRTLLNVFGVVAFGLSSLLVSGAASAAGKAAKSPADWRVLGAGDVKSGAKYTLRNLTENQSLRYGERTWGINLVWDKSTSLNNIRFERKGGGVLKYGDVVAIHLDKGSYLRYERRTIGVNLGWSKTPMYEFMMLGGKKGTPVKAGTVLGIYSMKEKDFLIYGDRPAGVGLRWWKDRELAGGLLDRAKAAAADLARWGFRELADHYLGK